MGVTRIYLREAISSVGTEDQEGTKAELARVLGISRAAVGQWNPRKPLPKKYVNILKKRYPMRFGNRF